MGDADANGDDPPRLSEDGLLLAVAGAACLLAAATAAARGQPRPVVVFGLLAGVPAAVAAGRDAATDYVPGTPPQLLVGGAALVAALSAVTGDHRVNAATFLLAAALVGWRVVDVEFRGAGR